MKNSYRTYAGAGVDTKKEDLAMKLIMPLFEETFKNRKGLIGESLLRINHYAAIIKITDKMAVAFKIDGVGTKTYIAQYMDKYDTVGIDCVAMNVNDIICTGTEPTSILDYLAIQKSDPDFVYEIAKGLKKGADMAKVSIVGGETAILPEMINGVRPNRGFDLAGAGLGTINPSDIIDGSKIKEGDSLIGISSSGIHSNGFTLARNILLKRFSVSDYIDELGRTLGEELLEPTYIYVDEIMDMKNSGLELKSVAHITSDGLLNLLRIGENIGYRITHLPEPQSIYKLIQKYGDITNQEMYQVYNMGIGMCVVVPPEQRESALQTAEKYGKKAFVLGTAVKDSQQRIFMEPLKMVGYSDKGEFR